MNSQESDIGEELIKLWEKQFSNEEISKEEFIAKLETAGSQLHEKADAAAVEQAGLEALVWFAHRTGNSIKEAIKVMGSETPKTPEEIRYIQAWDKFMSQWRKIGSVLL